MTRLIIVRHAESVYNCENRIQGHCDSKLTPKGVAQARRLARRVKNFKIDKIYSSDLGRAYTTTMEMNKFLKAPITRDPLLREIYLGDWEGMTAEDVDQLYDNGYQKWLKKPSAARIPKCEKLGHFRRRVTTRLDQIARQNRGNNLLVVTHGGVIMALLSEWLMADFDNLLLNLQVDNTSLTWIDHTQKRVRLHAINDTGHLGPKEKRDTVFFGNPQYP
ncbi:MAG: histidine phosphatase family protein [Candidatus Omnitrophica bacterium]|nr:histidine phosphatase family protein [Candidatus Omnitrophota bacterium]